MKEEQKTVLMAFLVVNDVFALPPNDFYKSLIYQVALIGQSQSMTDGDGQTGYLITYQRIFPKCLPLFQTVSYGAVPDEPSGAVRLENCRFIHKFTL